VTTASPLRDPQPVRTTWTTVLCDSLEKVFPDTEPRAIDSTIALHAFRGETVSVQVAFLPPSLIGGGRNPHVVVDDIAVPTGIRAEVGVVDLVPVTFVAFDGHDAGYLRDTAGMYPDPIRPLGRGDAVQPFVGQWRAIWIDVVVGADAAAATVPLTITLRTSDGAEVGTHTLDLVVVGATLPPLELVNTHWFHCDGLALHYGVEVFSEEHWAIIDRFLGMAAEIGINSILTPVWTPPLDTPRGAVRLPVQLLGIRDTGDGTYAFDFTNVRRWIALARKHGIVYLEIAHLFTQWGATATPAVYVERDGVTERRFGWDVPATDPSYRRFLEALLPELRAVLDAEWGLGQVFFHISDEPHGDQATTYLAARQTVDDLLEGATIIDALSDFELYASGTVPIPVVATDAAEPFLEAGVDPLWLYYCVGQNTDVANRFIGMPSSRNRALGAQLYLTGAAGFLQWGFNFYLSWDSSRVVDPFQTPDAAGGFPAGDPFLVYPGPGGVPWHSVRSRVFAEAVNDVRLMQLVRDHAGDDVVRGIVDPDATSTLKHYSLDPDHYRRMRAALVERLA
jgi:hypothetical protein